MFQAQYNPQFILNCTKLEIRDECGLDYIFNNKREFDANSSSWVPKLITLKKKSKFCH